MGAKKKPFYRVVIAQSEAPRDGDYVEIVGTYNPLTDPSTFQVQEERVKEWLRRGAQPTERVARLLTAAGVTA
jgi:small subunit ribosomal protein S16